MAATPYFISLGRVDGGAQGAKVGRIHCNYTTCELLQLSLPPAVISRLPNACHRKGTRARLEAKTKRSSVLMASLKADRSATSGFDTEEPVVVRGTPKMPRVPRRQTTAHVAALRTHCRPSHPTTSRSSGSSGGGLAASQRGAPPRVREPQIFGLSSPRSFLFPVLLF